MYRGLARDTVPVLLTVAILGGGTLVLRALASVSAPSGGVRATTPVRDRLPFVDEAMASGLVPSRPRVGADDLAPVLNALHPDYVPSALVGLRFETQPLLGSLLALLVCGAALAPLGWLALDALGSRPAPRIGRLCTGLLLLALPVWILVVLASGIRVLMPEQIPLRAIGWLVYGACCLHLLTTVGSRAATALAKTGMPVMGLYVIVFHWWRPAFLSRFLPEANPLSSEREAIHAVFGADERPVAELVTKLATGLESITFPLLVLLVFGVIFLAHRLETWLGQRHPLLPLVSALGALTLFLFAVLGASGITVSTPRAALEQQTLLCVLGMVLLDRFRQRDPLRTWLRAGRDDESDPYRPTTGRLSAATRAHADDGRRIAAIRSHRADTGASLFEASALIEAYLAGR